VSAMEDEPPNLDTEMIKNWKRKAFNYSSEEKIGNLLLRAFDVMETVVTMGESDKLEYAVTSLESEMGHSLRYKDYRDSPLKDFIFGLAECIAVMVKPMINVTQEQLDREEEQLQDLPYDANGPSSVHSNFQYSPSKFEIDDMVLQNMNNRTRSTHSDEPMQQDNGMEATAAANQDLSIPESS
ncbi:hypothetical protein PFISCL1PPCAC_23804, partial [Pristionchus fissidentatus]